MTLMLIRLHHHRDLKWEGLEVHRHLRSREGLLAAVEDRLHHLLLPWEVPTRILLHRTLDFSQQREWVHLLHRNNKGVVRCHHRLRRHKLRRLPHLKRSNTKAQPMGPELLPNSSKALHPRHLKGIHSLLRRAIMSSHLHPRLITMNPRTITKIVLRRQSSSMVASMATPVVELSKPGLPKWWTPTRMAMSIRMNQPAPLRNEKWE